MILWIAVGIAGFIALIFIQGAIYHRRKRKKQLSVFKETFTEDYFRFPAIEFGFNYWWPAIKITFKNKSDLDRARKLGLTKRFEHEIQVIFKRTKDFDPTRAITYEFNHNDSDLNS